MGPLPRRGGSTVTCVSPWMGVVGGCVRVHDGRSRFLTRPPRSPLPAARKLDDRRPGPATLMKAGPVVTPPPTAAAARALLWRPEARTPRRPFATHSSADTTTMTHHRRRGLADDGDGIRPPVDVVVGRSIDSWWVSRVCACFSVAFFLSPSSATSTRARRGSTPSQHIQRFDRIPGDDRHQHRWTDATTRLGVWAEWVCRGWAASGGATKGV